LHKMLADPPPKTKPPASRTKDQPSSAPPPAAANPFSFGDAPAQQPPVQSKSAPKPADEDDVPDIVPLRASDDPFSFEGGARAPAKAKSKSKPALREVDETPSEDEGPDDLESSDLEPVTRRTGYRSKSSSGGIGKVILIVAVFGIAVGGTIAGVMAVLNSKKSPEQVNNEKKDEKDKKEEPQPAPVPPSKSGETPSAKDEKRGKDEKKPIAKKDPAAKKTPGSGLAAGALKLEPGRTIQFTAQAAKLERVLEPSVSLPIVPTLSGKTDAAFSLARKVFPPLKRDNDIGVLWQTEPGFQGRGEKLVLGIYSPISGKQANQISFEGDGLAEAACDLSVAADIFVHGHTGDNKINVWDVRKGSKLIDGFNPYADTKELKLAAVYLTEPPDSLITVSTTGAVLAFKVPTKEPIPGEFLPAKPASKPLAAGKSITIGPGRQSVVLAVGGSIYGVTARSAVSGRELAVVGEVGRSLGLAASGGDKLLYVFETDAEGKKEKAVMDVRGDDSHAFYRWPEKEAGEPVVAGWVGDDLAMVGTDRGSCVWFESEGKEFRPIGLVKTPGDKARHVASDSHWALLPDPADPKRCVLLEFAKPQSAIVGVLDNSKQVPTVLLNDKGLFK
jgi:hypothetical protein